LSFYARSANKTLTLACPDHRPSSPTARVKSSAPSPLHRLANRSSVIRLRSGAWSTAWEDKRQAEWEGKRKIDFSHKPTISGLLEKTARFVFAEVTRSEGEKRLMTLFHDARQEGYDPSLTLLAPRTQQADAERAALERSRPPSLPASSQGPGPDRRMGLPASSLPYASRDPSAPVISTLPRGQGERNKRRTTDSNSKSRNSRRHSKKQLSWWQKPRCLGDVSSLSLARPLVTHYRLPMCVPQSCSWSSSSSSRLARAWERDSG
jgi:hypothetical protein